MSNVPCNGCTICCRNAAIILMEDENIADYEHEEWNGQIKIKQKSNGDCIYLDEKGCSIYDRRPKVCRDYDCRAQFLSLTKARRAAYVQAGLCGKEEFERGKQLQWTLTLKERKECIEARKATI